MKDRAGVIKAIEGQLAVAKETGSDFISLTTGEGKAILRLLGEQPEPFDVAYYPEEEAEAEIEGGGMTWYFACGECHAALPEHNATHCPNCGRKIKWT